jgi:serine/threonine protein kinase
MDGAGGGFSTEGIPEGTPGAQKTGFLTKQGHFRKTWKKRYFVLEWPILRYYRNMGDSDPAGEIDCEGVTLSDSTNMAKTGRENCFGIFHKDREPYFLQSESTQDMMEWVQAIRNSSAVGMIDFDQLKKLGEGAYGLVFLVRHRTTNQMLAMKTISKEQTRREGAVENTKLERDILMRVRHPFVVQMQYAFQTSEKLFMVMDYVNAGDLYSHLLKKKRFPEATMKVWAAEIGLAVGYLHEVGVVFRDLKPENVLLDMNGHAHLTDFGLSKTIETSGQKLHTFCGTPYYLAPELITHGSTARGKGKGYSKDIDWWAVGILCYELLIGDPPFRGKSAQEVYKAIVNKPIASVEASLRRFSPQARSLIVGLLERKVDCRIGYGERDVITFKQHPFFADIDWDLLLMKGIPVDYTPPRAPKGQEDEALADHYSRKNQEVTALHDALHDRA